MNRHLIEHIGLDRRLQRLDDGILYAADIDAALTQHRRSDALEILVGFELLEVKRLTRCRILRHQSDKLALQRVLDFYQSCSKRQE